MANTYYIINAPTQAGVLLIEQLLAQNEQNTIVAQGFGNLHTLAALCKTHKGRIRTFDVDLGDLNAVGIFLRQAQMIASVPTHTICLPHYDEYNYAGPDEYATFMQRTAGSIAIICEHFLPAMEQNHTGRVVIAYPEAATALQSSQNAMAGGALQQLVAYLAGQYAGESVTVNGVSLPQKNPDAAIPALLFLLSEEAALINGIMLPLENKQHLDV